MIHQKTMEVKLIDFGSTMPLTDELSTKFYGTQKFAAPEAFDGQEYNLSQQEVWTLGTLLYVLIFKMDPFANDDEIMDLEIERRIERLRTSSYGKDLPPIKLSDAGVDAISCMLAKNPEDRPKIEEILELPFFNE